LIVPSLGDSKALAAKQPIDCGEKIARANIVNTLHRRDCAAELQRHGRPHHLSKGTANFNDARTRKVVSADFSTVYVQRDCRVNHKTITARR
jgi:hypothetical protein